MTDLEEVFGEDLAQSVKEQTAKRRQERNAITDEQLAVMCAEAVNNNRFQEGEPQFKYTTENNVTHTVLLMQVPDLENGTVWEYLDEPWDGAASLPLDYLGEWMRCTFPDKDLVKKLETGDWYVVVGDIDEYEKDNGEIVESVYPVRGLASLAEAKEYAKQALSEEGFAVTEEEESEPDETKESDEDDESSESKEDALGDLSEEEEEDDQEEESDDDSSSGGMFGSSSDDDDSSSSGGGLSGLMEEEGVEEDEEEEDDEPTVPYDDIANVVEELGEQEEAVWEVTEGDDRLERLVEVVSTKLELDNDEAVAEVILDVLEEHREDDEDDDDEDMDQLF